MAATLTYLTQRALSAYTFIECDHPLQVAWSDYAFARANALPLRQPKQRLKAELHLEALLNAA